MALAEADVDREQDPEELRRMGARAARAGLTAARRGRSRRVTVAVDVPDTLKADLEKATAGLVGSRLWSSGRAADMQSFSFGERRMVTTLEGDVKEVGELALHVQCPWRIVQADKIVVGSRDLLFLADETAEVPEDFDWDGVVTRRDRRIATLFEDPTRIFTVQKINVGDAGALRIAFDDGYGLELFPHDSLTEEDWRLFRPGRDEPHVVVSGNGLQP